MSGIVGSKLNIRGSGHVAKLGTDGQVLTSAGAGQPPAFEDLAGGISWQSVVTASTLTAVAGNGYWIDTTSNTCTITLPASASNGDEIIFSDYASNWGTNSISLDTNSLKYQGSTKTAGYDTDDQIVHIVYSGSTNGWIPISDEVAVYQPHKPNTNGIFGFGYVSSTEMGMTNLVSSAGVIASDVTAVGTARVNPGACEFGFDKAIFIGGQDASAYTAVSNLVSNAGVVASDTAAVAGVTARYMNSNSYGRDKGICAGGGYPYTGVSNLISNVGVVGSDVTAVMGGRYHTGSCEYGSPHKDLGIVAYGNTGGVVSTINLISNTGVVASDTSGTGTVRYGLAGCDYGTGTGIMAYGLNHTVGDYSMSNLISDTGTVASDGGNVGTARRYLAACEFGGDKGIFMGGHDATPTVYAVSNIVSNTGSVATDTAAVVGVTARYHLAGASYG
jgi:hypothetical protein